MLILVCIGACRSYEPRPLDVAAMREEWLARSPGAEGVRQFADRLSIAENVPERFDASDGLTLREGEAVALVFNRQLRVARLEAGVTRASAAHAGAWDDPVIGVDLERIVRSVPDPWVVAGTLGLTLPISGRLAAERARAGAALGAELTRLGALEQGTRTALRERWIEWSAQCTRARLADELAAELQEIADLARRQEEGGVVSRIDARVFRVEVAVARADAIAGRARRRELELQLRDLMGLAPDAPVELVETIGFDGRSIEPGAMRAALESGNAELAAARAEYEVAERTLRLEIRKQYPDLTVGPGFGSDQGDERVLLGLSLPLPLWNANRRGIAEADAAREAARGRYEEVYERLGSRLAVAQMRYEAGRTLLRVIESEVVPLADEQEAEIRRVAGLGRVDPLLMLQAIKARFEAKVRLVEARAAAAVGAILVEELVGFPAPVAIEPPRPDSGGAQ